MSLNEGHTDAMPALAALKNRKVPPQMEARSQTRMSGGAEPVAVS